MQSASFGPYVLVERIGLGARSEVLRARRQTPRGTEMFALKRALAGAIHDKEIHLVLAAEAELVAKFNHPGIVRALDSGLLSGVPYVLYELVEGTDLEKVLARARERKQKLPMEVALHIGIAIAEALDYVHSFRGASADGRPIVHRDVGPSNVLIGWDGTVKLADFGIAKVPGRNTTTGVGEIKGTIRYMSPEQVRGDELDPRSDQYSLGALLLEMATGQAPFDGLRPVDILQELAKGHWLDPHALGPELPPPLREVLCKVLAPGPAERYDTSAKLLDALRGILEALQGRPETGAFRIDLRSSAIGRVVGELFPSHAQRDKSSEESRDMADEKGGSDLDVFEGLAKKSVRPSGLPGAPPAGPVSGRVSNIPGRPSVELPVPVPPPTSLRQSTLLGVTPPPNVSSPGGPTSTPLPPPPPKPLAKTLIGSNVPPPPASTAAPAVNKDIAFGQTQLSSSGPPAPSKPPAPPPKSTATPLPPPPPMSAKAPSGPPASKAPNTLVAAVPPPPKPPTSIGSAVGMPSVKPEEPAAAKEKEDAEEKTPPTGTAVPKKEKASAGGASTNEMDWEDEEESTHVFEKRKHAMNKGPRPAAGAPPEPLPPPARPNNAATLMMASGGSAAPRSVPPPVAPPQQKTIVMEQPSPHAAPAAPAATVAIATPTPPSMPSRRDEPTIVRQRESSGGSKLGVILGGLALVAVVGLAVFMLLPRKGDLRITVKSKTGDTVAIDGISVDGQRRCDTTPCLVTELSPGSRTVQVIKNGVVIAEKTHEVKSGHEESVTINIEAPTTSDKPSPVVASVSATQSASAPTSATPAPVSEGTGFSIFGPSGVKVLLDGKEKGVLEPTSAFTIKDLKPGDYTVKLDGGERYKSFEKKITVAKDKIEDLGEQKLVVVKGLLKFDIKTEGAQVMLVRTTPDNKKLEKKLEGAQLTKPISIPADEAWSVVATKKGFDDFKEEIKFDDGNADKTLTVELHEKGKPVATSTVPTVPTTPNTGTVRPPTSATTSAQPPSGMGTLSINSIPASNAILDGRPVGRTPISGLSVSAGPHTVTFKHPEKGSKSVSVNVKPGGKAVASTRFD